MAKHLSTYSKQIYYGIFLKLLVVGSAEVEDGHIE